MGACDSAGANQGKIVSFGHQHGLGLPSWPQHLPPPPHPMSRASSVSILEMGQKAIESWTGIGDQWLKGMWLLGWTRDMNTGPPPFPSRLRVPRAVQGLPRVSISKATHVKWESNCPVGSTRAAGRRCCTPCLRLWLRLGLSMGELPDVRWCAVVGVPGVRGRIPGPGPVPTVIAQYGQAVHA